MQQVAVVWMLRRGPPQGPCQGLCMWALGLGLPALEMPHSVQRPLMGHLAQFFWPVVAVVMTQEMSESLLVPRLGGLEVLWLCLPEIVKV